LATLAKDAAPQSRDGSSESWSLFSSSTTNEPSTKDLHLWAIIEQAQYRVCDIGHAFLTNKVALNTKGFNAQPKRPIKHTKILFYIIMLLSPLLCAL